MFKCKKSKKAGITFIEMIIVMAIFAFIAGVTLFSYRKFSNNVQIQNVMQDVALAITRAQRTAIAGALPRTDSVIYTSNGGFSVMAWAPSYGVHINMNNPTQLIYFVDQNSDAAQSSQGANDEGRYIYENPEPNDSSCSIDSTSECLDLLQFPENYKFNEICINQPYSEIGQADGCGSGTSVSYANIVFTRPEPTPVINTSDTSGASVSSITLYIYESSTEVHRTVTLYSTGQVQVK